MNRKDFATHALPHLENLYRTALYVLGNESDAQDLVRESLVRAYKSWHECQFSANRRAWLFRIMVNALSSKYRPSPDLSTAINNADEIDGYFAYSRWMSRQPIDHFGNVPFSAISEDDVRKAIAALPDDFRLIVVLSLLENFSYREIADIVDINLETVRSKLHQGRKLMQKELFDLVGCENNHIISEKSVSSKS